MFTGTYTAIVTPFRNGQIDEPALEKLVRSQVKGGVDGIVPVGTTGESPTLDHDEHIRVIALAVKFAAGRVKVLAGTGSNSTKEAIELTRQAEAAGADGSLQVAPLLLLRVVHRSLWFSGVGLPSFHFAFLKPR
jgi:4-hydroxy-tetrahydrodipicolinate synthase